MLSQVHSCRNRIEIDTHGADHEHACTIGIEAKRRCGDDVLEPITLGHRFDRFERDKADTARVVEQLGSKPTFAHQAIERMRPGAAATMDQDLGNYLGKRFIRREIWMHNCKRALVVGSDADLESLIRADPLHPGNFEASALGDSLPLLVNHPNVVELQKRLNMRRQRLGLVGFDRRRNRPDQLVGRCGARIDCPNDGFGLEQRCAACNRAGSVTVNEKVERHSIVFGSEHESLTERTIRSNLEQYGPLALVLEGRAPRDLVVDAFDAPKMGERKRSQLGLPEAAALFR